MQLKQLIGGTALALSLGLQSNTSQAAVTYDFTAHSSFAFNGETFTGSFSATVPDFVIAPTRIAVSDLNSCSVTSSSGAAATCFSQRFYFDVVPGQDGIGFHVNTAANPGTTVLYYFADGSFSGDGTFTSDYLGEGQQATLTVSGSPAVPEPTVTTLLLTGFGALAMVSRHRKAWSRG